MYFKTIELQGFKSFADLTNVHLEPGITAIVGPNGCGKSNILDAMRWALGEQSAKVLRGTHMQDIIFNGSENRPATGMAEVTLTFDNADGKLPLDFAEVQITRRVYRSGESEYLINKAPCRLRDIQELFMDTGIGTSAYSLIGQGKIDMVLSSKPEDRRYLFEEAAGIIKYKTRKKVALRKLDSAEQNLLRLGDVIAEVERQMRNLKRQVNAAIRHRELTDALRGLEIRNAWLRYNELSEQIFDLKEQFAVAQDTYEKASTETSSLEARLEALNLKRIELERVLMARRDGQHQIDTEMERIERQTALLRKEIEFSKQQQEQFLREAEEFRERAATLASSQGQTGEQQTAIQAEIQQLQNDLAARQQAYNDAQAEVTQSEQRLEEIRAHAIDAMATRSRTQTDLETAAAGVAQVDTQLQAIYNQQTGQNTRHEEVSAALQQVQQQESEARKKLEDATAQRTQRQERRTQQTEKMEKLNQEWQALREKKSSQEARLKSLRELRDSYEGFAAGVRAVMMAKQKEHEDMDGIIGPVGDLLSSDKEYGPAIEAALGGNINNIIVDNADAAKLAVNFLKKHQAGRVTFLPLDTIRSTHQDDRGALKGLPGVIGKAIDYVQFESYLLPAVQYLLQDTMIVETIDDAIRIARSERRFPRLVTLDGEVVSSAGAVTGGRTRNESRGLLGRSAEIEELEQAVDSATKRTNQMAVEGHNLTTEIKTLGDEIRAFEQQEAQFRRELNEAGVAVARHSTDLENLTRTGQQLTQQRDALLAQRAELEQRQAAAQEKISLIATDDEALQLKTVEAQESAAHARAALSRVGDSLADLRVQLASLMHTLEEAERNKIREQREHAEALQEAQRRAEAAEKLTQKQQELEGSIADTLERAKALSETREEAHEKVLEAQSEQHALVEESEKLAKSLKDLRAKSQTAQKEVHKLELELSHKEERIGFFQERILQEYNLALASLEEKDVGTDEYDETEREALIAEHRKDLQKLGTVNLMAIEEYEALEKREEFLKTQSDDLRKAKETLLNVVARIDKTIEEMFMDTFRTVAEQFKAYFRRLFNGGQARVYLVDENDPLESGIEIEARPPGKKPQTISLLSGGEQAMTAIALLFSIFSAKPSPFCVLDEVDAPLDDANIGRFLNLVDEFAGASQFIIITHSKQTMAHADALFGVTQQERGVSQLVSVRFDEVTPAETAA